MGFGVFPPPQITIPLRSLQINCFACTVEESIILFAKCIKESATSYYQVVRVILKVNGEPYFYDPSKVSTCLSWLTLYFCYL